MKKWQIFKETLIGRLRERQASSSNYKSEHGDDDDDNDPSESKHQNIEISELTRSVILIWFIAILISIFSFCVELITEKRNKKNKYKVKRGDGLNKISQSKFSPSKYLHLNMINSKSTR